MPIVKPPTVVQHAMDEFIAKLFINQPQRNHLANYLTGLMICPNKTIAGMTSEQPNASDQSCLNRHHHKTTRITEVDWDAQQLNEERIRWLQNFDDMKFHDRSIIALDDVLIEKSGKYVKDSSKRQVQSAECREQRAESREQRAECRVQSAECREQR